MRPILRSFTLAHLFTLAACGTLEMQIERDPALDDEAGTQTMVLPQKNLNDPVQPGNNIEDSGELGMVYFWMSKTAGADPSVRIGSIARLPGSCVAGLSTCPPPEELETPFEINDASWQAISWSPDGRLAISLAMPTNRQTLQLISALDEAPETLATFSTGRISFVA